MSALPRLGEAVPKRGSRLMVSIGRTVLALLGWRVTGEIPNLPKFVVAVAPHTSNWDFVVGSAAMFALDLRLSFIGKHTLFVGPFASVLRWMGGIPVDRSSPHGVVAESVRAFEAVDQRILAVAPQGTRKPVPHFRSGFIHIAHGARVPILLASLDYAACTVRLGPVFHPTGAVDADLERIEAFFTNVRGKRAR